MSDIYREGDFIESVEGLIFDVKGLVHPPRKVIAYVRYIPDPEGTRSRQDTKYRKVYELSDRLEFLRRYYPNYLVHDPVFDEDLNEVPIERVKEHYQPLDKTKQLLETSGRTALETKCLKMIRSVSEASKVPAEEIGVSGSLLVGLADSGSDIDLVVYSSHRSQRVHQALAKLLRERNEFLPYEEEKIQALHQLRHKETGVSFSQYAYSELRKDFQGYFRGTDFFIRYVKDWSEINETYGSIIYKNQGYGRIEGITREDREAIFTPCTYLLEDVKVLEGPKVEPIAEVVSFRGQFCEQAVEGEKITAQGKLERKSINGKISYRLLLGNTPKDYLIVASPPKSRLGEGNVSGP